MTIPLSLAFHNNLANNLGYTIPKPRGSFVLVCPVLQLVSGLVRSSAIISEKKELG